MYDAPFYQGSGKLEGKAALITGGDSGIGRAVAVLFAKEGANIAIVHLEEKTDAKITSEAVDKEARRCLIIEGDVSKGSSAGVRWPASSRNSASSTCW
jgi:NAD(P)-dependent dehydrogenase (short-subunit alcohol dehydrogenase family)